MERCACYDYGWCPYLGEVDCRGYIEWCDYEWLLPLKILRGKNMSEDFMLTDIVDFVEVFAPIFEKYFNSMNSISPETKREMAFGATQEEMEWCDDDYEDGIRW